MSLIYRILLAAAPTVGAVIGCLLALAIIVLVGEVAA